MNPFKSYFCYHEVKIMPVISDVFRNLDTLKEVGIFNRVDYKCCKCETQGTVSVPVILSTNIPASLIGAIAEGLISNVVVGWHKARVLV